jgi:hypothetical protein
MSQWQESEDEQMARALKESLRSYEEERLLQETLKRFNQALEEETRKVDTPTLITRLAERNRLENSIPQMILFPYPGEPPIPPRQFPMMPRMMPGRGLGPGSMRPPRGYPPQQQIFPYPGEPPIPPRQFPMMPRMMPGRGGIGEPGNMGPPVNMTYEEFCCDLSSSRGYPPQQQMRQGAPAPPSVNYTNQVRNQPLMQMSGPPMGHPMPVQQRPMLRPSGLDYNALAQANFSTQKNMISEKLYPLVLLHEPEFAVIITGKLLEMDNAELLHLLESPEALLSKVYQAMTVLHNQGSGGPHGPRGPGRSGMDGLCQRRAPSGNRNAIDFNNRTNNILQSLDPPPVGRIRQCLEFQKGMGGLLVGATNDIASEAGGNCSIRFLDRDISTRFDGTIGDCLLIEADDQESVEAAEVALVARAADILAVADRKPPATQPASPIQEKKEDTLAKKKIKQDQVSSPNTRPSHPAASSAPSASRHRHILLNSTEIFLHAQRLGGNSTDPTLRLNAINLARVLGMGQASHGTRLVVGTKPSPSNPIWKYWRDAGFQVHVGGSSDYKSASVELEENKIATYLLDQTNSLLAVNHTRETLVLCIGKGIELFESVIKVAAKKGWNVEIWSWSSYPSPLSSRLSQQFPQQVTLHQLDQFDSEILFRYRTPTTSVCSIVFILSHSFVS